MAQTEKFMTANDFLVMRTEKRISMQKIMADTGISKATISRYERGKEIQHQTWLKLNEYYFKTMRPSPTPLSDAARKTQILAASSDLAKGFLFYDRKNDEELRSGEIQKAVEDGIVTKAEIIESFSKELNEWW